MLILAESFATEIRMTNSYQDNRFNFENLILKTYSLILLVFSNLLISKEFSTMYRIEDYFLMKRFFKY